MAAERVRVLEAHLAPHNADAARGGAAAGTAGTLAAGAQIAYEWAPPGLEDRGRKALETLEANLKLPQAPRQGPLRPQIDTKKFQYKAGSDLMKFFDKMDDLTVGATFNIADHLPGPLRSGRDRREILQEEQNAINAGQQHALWLEWQRRYCSDGMNSNMAVPYIMFRTGEGKQPCLTQQIILCHPKDCDRIAREHIKKQPVYVALLGSGVISTTDNAHWKRQRDELIPAFNPISSLAKIYPVVVRRAEKCADRLDGLAGEDASRRVNISEFLLHEAMAQLQLGLFGMPEFFLDATNKRFRASINRAKGSDPRFTRRFLESMMEMFKDPAHTYTDASRDVWGPLSAVVNQTVDPEDTQSRIGNAFLFAFAGHDTTGHTMTWLVFELARNQALQRRLQKEVDEFFEYLNGRPMAYRDLDRLKFMTRCITESMRLWPVVPQGTFRELQHDDYVHGPGGERVPVPKGTMVQIVHFLLHRNPDLWGPDADTYNPDRDFQGKEIWNGVGFAGYNPSSERFAPFTFPPRDCMGKNFAQSEMRAILAHIFRRFTFTLAGTAKQFDKQGPAPASFGLHYGTMGPQDLEAEGDSVPPVRHAGDTTRAVNGLWVNVARRPVSRRV